MPNLEMTMILGPYLVFSGENPNAWCYLEASESGFSYYTTPYPCHENDVKWESKPFSETIFVCDTGTPINRLCYFEKGGQLYEGKIRLIGDKKEPTVGLTEKISFTNNTLLRSSPERARWKDAISAYERPADLIVPKLPSATLELAHDALFIDEIGKNIETPLTTAQQSIIINTIAQDWVILNSLSIDKQKKVIDAILTGKIIKGDDELASAANALRPYLFTSHINVIFGERLKKNEKSPSPSIGEVQDYIYALFEKALKQSGGDPVPAPTISIEMQKIRSTPCGGLPQDSAFSLIYTGLSDHHSELLNLIIQYETLSVYGLTLEQLSDISRSINGVLNPIDFPEYRDLANDLLPAFADDADSQEEALNALHIACREIKRAVINQAIKILISMPSQELSSLARVQLYDFQTIVNFINELDKRNLLTPENRSVIIADHISAFQSLSAAHLLTPENRAALIQNKKIDKFLVRLAPFESENITQEKLDELLELQSKHSGPDSNVINASVQMKVKLEEYKHNTDEKNQQNTNDDIKSGP